MRTSKPRRFRRAASRFRFPPFRPVSNAAGHLIIDHKHRGVRIYARLGVVSPHEAARRLAVEIERVEREFERKVSARPRFIDWASRYLAECCDKRSVSDIAWHVRLLMPYIGDLEVRAVHNGTYKN